MQYIKELDGLRAIALFLVVVSHWLSKNALVASLNLGQIGVSTFFVLSGFLITSILFDNRTKAEMSGAPKIRIMFQFVVRRALRIFPIYYLFIIILFVLGDRTGTNIRSSIPYFITYMANFYFYKIRSWDGMLSHLWTLSVEEQFYLLWPWVMLFVSRRYLLFSIALFVAVGVSTGYAFADYEGFGLTLPFTCFDSFGLGALLAFVTVWYKEYLAVFCQINSVAAIICILVLIFAATSGQAMLLPNRTIQSVVALWIIAYIVYGKYVLDKSFYLLNNNVLVYLGRISYGMYLYHLPLQYDYKFIDMHIVPLLPGTIAQYPEAVIFFINLLLLIIVSSLSWYLLERPILTLKRRFEYLEQIPVKLA